MAAEMFVLVGVGCCDHVDGGAGNDDWIALTGVGVEMQVRGDVGTAVDQEG